MKRTLVFLFFFIASNISYSQMSIEYCQNKAKENYPIYRNTGILENLSRFSIKNANKNYFPQLNFSAKASYQSDVTSVDIELPFPIDLELPTMTKDQYQAVFELSQMIWDGGYTKHKKQEIRAELESKKSSLEVELYTLRDRVANIFFGILSIREQKSQAKIMDKELERNYSQIQAFMDGGLANQSDLDLIKVEQLNLKQRLVEISILEKSYIRVLSLLMGIELLEDAVFEEPNLDIHKFQNDINRPELLYFESQVRLLDTKIKMINSQFLPNLGLYAQGGYGRPGLNMFSQEPDFFSIIGLRLSWNITSLYTRKDNIRIIESNKELINSNKTSFILNTNLQKETQHSEIEKLKSLLLSDIEIIILRERIKLSSQYKLENGIISTSDYIKDVNAFDIASQNKILHKTELLMSIYKYNNIINRKDEK